MRKSPKPSAAQMFAGIKGLVASGPGKTKKVSHVVVRPEGKVSIDAGAIGSKK